MSDDLPAQLRVNTWTWTAGKFSGVPIVTLMVYEDGHAIACCQRPVAARLVEDGPALATFLPYLVDDMTQGMEELLK